MRQEDKVGQNLTEEMSRRPSEARRQNRTEIYGGTVGQEYIVRHEDLMEHWSINTPWDSWPGRVYSAPGRDGTRRHDVTRDVRSGVVGRWDTNAEWDSGTWKYYESMLHCTAQIYMTRQCTRIWRWDDRGTGWDSGTSLDDVAWLENEIVRYDRIVRRGGGGEIGLESGGQECMMGQKYRWIKYLGTLIVFPAA